MGDGGSVDVVMDEGHRADKGVFVNEYFGEDIEVRGLREGMITKTSIMLGLGETEDELKESMSILRAIDVDILTLGQSLQVMSLKNVKREQASVSVTI
nr:lipoyl synthase, chloroplastic-like [Tanacetum cinerariifolium]